MKHASARRMIGLGLSQGAATLTQYAIENPFNWTVTNGCQKGRVSSIHRTQAMPVLIAPINKNVCQLKRKPSSRGWRRRIGGAASSMTTDIRARRPFEGTPATERAPHRQDAPA